MKQKWQELMAKASANKETITKIAVAVVVGAVSAILVNAALNSMEDNAAMVVQFEEEPTIDATE